MSAPLLLASRSPQRRAILTALGIEFDVVPASVPELAEGQPERLVEENARRKAAATAALRPEAAVLGCDTEVVVDGRILGKPADRIQARKLLEMLAGREHRVLSGLVLLDPGGEERVGVAETRVRFRPPDPDLLDLYLASGEWQDRAGGYAIQGLGSALVAAIEGDFSNVVGLPVALLLRLAPELLTRP